ncbi:SCO7613 C-terminal domain-containing membrane protein [Mangrovihabitans endophyticus]|uniref:Uncharacterized protein n=1 Tax=Mangrovihabitans endophyticus TaxID=1751298 RepID=A0A8J3FR74_9ACTN|nr:hypothetical protein [Mangrovihabitans endophyticus]GGL07251.1 hypothetical protein GCM10012284_46880 [Mangrovihabitans endophyticus]
MAQADEPEHYEDELTRIEASIADLKIRDMAAAAERSQIAGELQAAQFQRDILAHEHRRRNAQTGKPRRLLRRKPDGSTRASEVPPPPQPTSQHGTVPTPPGPRVGRETRERRAERAERSASAGGPPDWARTARPGVASDGATALIDDPPPTETPAADRPPRTEHQPHPPEASTKSVQNILLVLSALLLAVAAVVSATVAVDNPVGRSLVLLLMAALALFAAPWILQRELSSTAETVAAVGLILVPVVGYALQGRGALAGVTVTLLMGVTFLVTAVVAFVYAGLVRLAAPRYATVLALQPVPLLLGYPLIESPAGWALALTVVALVDLVLLTTVIQRVRMTWPPRRPAPSDGEAMSAAEARDAGARDFAEQEYGPDRPETRPEEPDLVIPSMSGRRRWLPSRIFPGPRPAGAPAAGSVPARPPAATAPSAVWLSELTFALLCAGVAGALLYGGGALIGADAVPDAVRSALILLLAALTAVAAAHMLNQLTARNIAGGVLTLTVIGGCARVAAVAASPWALAVAAAAVACAGAVISRVPTEVRRGPQLAAAGALSLIGVFVAVDALRAAFAPVQAARPLWHADTAGYADRIAAAAGPSGWLLVLGALLVTVAAAMALPTDVRHESAVAGAALTVLAVPSALGLPWSTAPWPLVLAAIAFGASGLMARSHRIAVAHIAAAGVVGLFGAGAALSAVWLTAAVLTALAGAGVMITIAARQIARQLYAWVVGDWASGAAALALPGAAVTAALAVSDRGSGPPPTETVTVPALAFGFLAVAGTLTYAAVFQVARRDISFPLTAGTGLGAAALALAAILSPGATAPDIWVGALLLAAAGLLIFAPSIDRNRRPDWQLDGPDVAAAAATVAICGALARVAALAFPGAPLFTAGLIVVLVGLGIRLLPGTWSRGPVRGLALAGGVAGAIAAWQALAAGLRIIAMPGPLWASDLSGYGAGTAPGAWQAPVTLALIAVAAAAALPPPYSFDVGAVCAALAAIGAPAAFGLPWWSPLLIGGAVALAYGIAAVAAVEPRAAIARAAVAVVVSLHFAGAGLNRPWSSAMAFLLITATGVLVAVMARTAISPEAAHRALDDNRADEAVVLSDTDTGVPRHREQIGGAALGAALLAAPGVLAALAAEQGRSAQVVLTAALAGSSLSLALLALAGRRAAPYLPWATVGIVGGATVTAIASIPTSFPTALYAAAAALLGVIAELLRGAHGTFDRAPRRAGLHRIVDPATGAVAVAILPTVLALISLLPALRAALVDPFQQLDAVWDGPVAAMLQPSSGVVDGTGVLAAVLLTVAAALAALGFGGHPAEAVPVILPGLAITLLIAPVTLSASWPAATGAALAVFTIVMLGLALTPPPVATRATLLRSVRNAVFVVGLMAGGAGLAGSLATRPLTLFTLGSAVGVGLVAAVTGRTAHARILGWLFAAVMAQFFVLTAQLSAGLTPAWAAFGVLAVGAALLIVEAAVPRLGNPAYAREALTVEWSGYASALLAGALAFDSPPHLAALMAAWGAVLGLAASRPGRTATQRRNLFWLAVGFEIVGIWMFMTLSEVAVPEAYTLPFAALALLVGLLEARSRPELSSWAAYGPSLLAAFVPSLGIVLATDSGDLREVLLLLGAVLTLIIGSRLQQQAPVVIGAAATVVTAIHFATTLVGPWLVLVPVGVVLLFAGATNENRRRAHERFRGALGRMR